MTSRQRLDIIMTEKGLVSSREKAKSIILAGSVKVDGLMVDKAGTLISPESDIKIVGNPVPYVSKGGLKLQKALDVFNPPVKDRVYMDVGASTGGFTDCLLKYGAKLVYSIDVGYGQLAWKLRQDPKVLVMERRNIRDIAKGDLKIPPQGAVIDVAFISLKIVLPIVKDLLKADSHIITLIKPQFEAGREKVGKNGVVRSSKVHKEVLGEILLMAEEIGLVWKGLSFSPIKGPKGNIEFLAHFYKTGEDSPLYPWDREKTKEKIEEIVEAAHGQLINKGGFI